MKLRSVFVVMLAVICGVSAAVGVSQLRRPVEVAGKPETVPVVVAVKGMKLGQMVTPELVATREWPKDIPLEGSLSTVEAAVDRAVAIPLVAGEPILDAKLAAKDAGRGLAAILKPGMRAYTIQAAQAANSVAGFVLPGNRVDVLLNVRGNPQDETGGGSSTTLLQAVEILAINQELDAPADNKIDPGALSSVTLEVTPEQVLLLDLGQNLGKLSLSLRNPEDTAEAHTRPATLADIRFRQEPPVAATESNGAAPVLVDKGDERPEVAQIFTLRGNQWGQVLVGRQ